MIRVCYSKYHVGPKVFGEKEPYEDLSLTGGICERCIVEDLRDMEEWVAHNKGAENSGKDVQKSR